jgi:Uncharacterised nucleotidyltransferase
MGLRTVSHSAGPGELELLLLRAALSEGDEAHSSWHEASRRIGSIRRLGGESYRLLPLLYRNLAEQGVGGPGLAQLKGVYRHSWYANHLHFRRAGEVLGSLERASVDTLVLKGGALSRLYYDAPGTRPMEDVDVLVRRRQVHRAIEVLEREGWTPVDGAAPTESVLRTRHSAPWSHPRGGELDLHWSPLWQPTHEDPFWDHAIPLEIGGTRTRALCPEDQLFHLCVHGASWSMRKPYWLADAVMLLRSRSGELDWRRLVQQARANELSLALEHGLRFLRDGFECEVPTEVLAQLGAIPRSFPERLEHRLARARPYPGVYTLRSWTRYRRLAAREGKRASLGDFANYQRQFWGLANRRELAGFLLTRARQTVRRPASS